jgi:hypothetical protein
MASIASRFGLVAVLSLTIGGAVFGQVAQRQCGYDRWPVKILSDKDRERVNFTPVEITIAELTSIPIHEIPYPEQDSDLHLIVADLRKPDIRMIVEIPAPSCAEGTGHENDYRKAREALVGIPKGSVVEIIGVGFFDFIHAATDMAKNGIELHPVLKIAVVKP